MGLVPRPELHGTRQCRQSYRAFAERPCQILLVSNVAASVILYSPVLPHLSAEPGCHSDSARQSASCILNLMSLGIVIAPGGQLRLVPDPENLPVVSASVREGLERAFAQSSAQGLLLLASEDMGRELPLDLVFWREISRQLQGRFDGGVMKRLTQPKDGLFPQPQEIVLLRGGASGHRSPTPVHSPRRGSYRADFSSSRRGESRALA